MAGAAIGLGFVGIGCALEGCGSRTDVAAELTGSGVTRAGAGGMGPGVRSGAGGGDASNRGGGGSNRGGGGSSRGGGGASSRGGGDASSRGGGDASNRGGSPRDEGGAAGTGGLPDLDASLPPGLGGTTVASFDADTQEGFSDVIVADTVLVPDAAGLGGADHAGGDVRDREEEEDAEPEAAPDAFGPCAGASCSSAGTCRVVDGVARCLCLSGYIGVGLECRDIDECSLGTGACAQHASCANVPGSYTCTCDAGYYGDGTTCAPSTCPTPCESSRVCRTIDQRPLCVHPSCSPTRVSQIGGLTWNVWVEGNFAYSASGSDLFVYDVSDPLVAVLTGSLHLPATCRHIYVGNGVAYLSLQNSTLALVDLSVATHPVLLSTLNLDVESVRVDGSIAYASSSTGLLTLDVANLGRPFVRAKLPISDGAHGLRVRGHFAYVASKGLLIVDTQDPDHPQIAGQAGTPGESSDVDLYDHYAYVADWTGVVTVMDVSDPGHPSSVGETSTQCSPASIDIQGKNAYTGMGCLSKIDLSSPASPQVVATSDYNNSYQHVIARGDVLYVAGLDRGVIRMAASDFHGISSFNPLGRPGAIALRGRYAYVGVMDGVEIVDVRDPTAASIRAEMHGPTASLDVANDHLYVAQEPLGVAVFALTDPLSPTKTASLPFVGGASRIRVHGDFGYAATGNSDSGYALQVIDLHDADHPTLRGRLALPSDVRGMDASGAQVYLTMWSSGLFLADVSDPDHPVKVSEFAVPGTIGNVSVAGKKALVGSSDLLVVDVSNPVSPSLTATIPMSSHPVQARIEGDRLYVAVSSGLSVFDIADIQRPVTLASFRFPHETSWQTSQDLVLRDGYAFVSDVENGLLTFDITGTSNPKVLSTTPVDGYIEAIAKQNDHLIVGTEKFTTDLEYAIQSIDTSDPPHPTAGASIALSEPVLALAGGSRYLYGGTLSGVRVFDLVKPSAPAVLGLLPEDNFSSDLSLSGSYLYASLRSNPGSAIAIFNLLDPAAPALQRAPWPVDDIPVPRGVYAQGQTVYVAGLTSSSGDESAMAIYDVSDPLAPARRGSLRTEGSLQRLEAKGSLVFAVNDPYGLLVIDASVKDAPQIMAKMRLTDCVAVDIALLSDLACIACATGGLAFVDITDPAKPQFLYKVHTPDGANHVVAANGLAYAANSKTVSIVDPGRCLQ